MNAFKRSSLLAAVVAGFALACSVACAGPVDSRAGGATLMPYQVTKTASQGDKASQLVVQERAAVHAAANVAVGLQLSRPVLCPWATEFGGRPWLRVAAPASTELVIGMNQVRRSSLY